MIWIQICKMIIFFTSNTITPFTLTFLQTAMRAISLQKVHLWMEISAGCPNRGRRSLTKMDRLRNVQSSVWTLQQILPDVPSYSLHITGFMYPNFLQKHYAIYCIGSQKIGRTKKSSPKGRRPAPGICSLYCCYALLPLILKTIGSPPQSYHRHAV